MSAGNVYYDESLNCVPLQAYEITDQNGNPLGPYLMTTSETDSYVLDVTSLIAGAGVKPFYRSQELTDATDRAWRLDYYKPDAQTGTLWTTVMSGPITALANGDYELSVDLGLRWSEEGDNLNRLGQGQFGEVWKGLLSDGDNPSIPEYMVAAKTVKEADTNEMEEEASQIQKRPATSRSRRANKENMVN